MLAGHASAVRVKTDRRTSKWLVGQVLASAGILAVSSALALRLPELRGNPVLWLGFGWGCVAFIGYSVRTLIETGVIPRLWVKERGGRFVVWTWWSILRGSSVYSSTSQPLILRTGLANVSVIPGGPAGGWLTLRDGRHKVGLITYAQSPQAVLDEISGELARKGVALDTA